MYHWLVARRLHSASSVSRLKLYTMLRGRRTGACIFYELQPETSIWQTSSGRNERLFSLNHCCCCWCCCRKLFVFKHKYMATWMEMFALQWNEIFMALLQPFVMFRRFIASERTGSGQFNSQNRVHFHTLALLVSNKAALNWSILMLLPIDIELANSHSHPFVTRKSISSSNYRVETCD